MWNVECIDSDQIDEEQRPSFSPAVSEIHRKASKDNKNGGKTNVGPTTTKKTHQNEKQ